MMRLNLSAALGTMAATALLLTGCSLLPGGQAPAATPTPTNEPSAASCPDIEAHDFAVSAETTPLAPAPIAESVGLGDVLEGTCAYGFETPGEGFDGVAFFIIDPTDEDAAVFFGNAVGTAAQAGFAMGDTDVTPESMIQSGMNDEGASFLVAWFAEVDSGDGKLPDSSMSAMGLDSGDAVLIGSIQLAS